MNAARLAERVARESYGRLLALLAARTRDVAAAEDALADAFAAALTVWPRIGSPDNPEAWLFTAAKRKLIDVARRARTAAHGESQLSLNIEEIEAEMTAREAPDRRLELLFACADQAVDEPARTPLMLQTVLGLSAERTAAAFLIAPATMSQRLVRAKKRILDAGVAFATPAPEQWSERLAPVLNAIYAAFGEGWFGGALLSEEAIWLARVLLSQMPDEPEALGLLSLMLHVEARRPARAPKGGFVPTEQQDMSLWRADLQAEAERLLFRAAKQDRLGRFQLEAAIQSAHAARKQRGDVDWAEIVMLYDGLLTFHPSAVTQLNRAAAIARRDGAGRGLAELELIGSLKSYQPYWALRADLLRQLDRSAESRAAYDEAIARERDPAVIRFLSARRGALTL